MEKYLSFVNYIKQCILRSSRHASAMANATWNYIRWGELKPLAVTRTEAVKRDGEKHDRSLLLTRTSTHWILK